MFGQYRIGYAQDVGSGVQDPPGELPAAAEADADDSRGLRALFRKSRTGDPGGSPARPASLAKPPSAPAAVTNLTKPASAPATTTNLTKPAAAPPGEQPGPSRPASFVKAAAPAQPAGGTGPHASPPTGRPAARPGQAPPAARRPLNLPLASRSLVSPHLRQDPRLRVWIIRTVVAIVAFLGFMIWHGWRVGITAAAIYLAADIIYRSRTTSVVPTGVRVTSAQRYTRRRLRVLQPAGYLALNARSIPGTAHVIDHLVVGPAGIYSIDSQRMDKRLSLRMIGGMLYHGQRSMEERLDHATMEANSAAALIGAELGQKVRVHPVLVTYGPATMWKIITVKGVALLDGSRVGTYFRQQSKQTRGHHLDASQIAMVFAAAERALPPID